jgi:pimeloyl-ACP methyl ester carboxylesterase
MASERITVSVGGQALALEFAWVGPERAGLQGAAADPLVFLHEGLGSVAMWRDFPAQLCAALGRPGLVYSRPGYGRSTPRPAGERWGLDFMHIQAEQVLPALLAALGVTGAAAHDGGYTGRYHLLGHSDGGSISLIHAARFAAQVASCVVMAPHILVEEFGLISIREARRAYLETELRAKLAKYHDDVDSAFWGWNDIWLAPEFPQWRITELLGDIACPVLAIQGLDDQYGTLAQIEGIAQAHANTCLLKLPACGHSPHKDQPAAVIAACQAFFASAAAPAAA